MADMFFSDWDGTLIKNDDDMAVLKKIAMDELKRTIGNPRLWKKTKQLWEAKRHLKEMYALYKGNLEGDSVSKIYALYGREVLSGIPMERVINSARKYGSRAVRRLDGAFKELWEAAGGKSQIVILTAALEDGVCQVLTSKTKRSLNKNWWRPYVYIDGSRILQENWVAKGIELKNYDGKAERMKQIICQQRERPDRIIYMGNDFRDKPCVKFADIFIVAPLGTNEFRQEMALEYGSKVRTPTSEPREVYKALTMG